MNVIADGRVGEAEGAVAELRAALAAAGVCVPGVHVDRRVWDAPEHGVVRLVELGSMLPGGARELAAVVRRGTAPCAACEQLLGAYAELLRAHRGESRVPVAGRAGGGELAVRAERLRRAIQAHLDGLARR
ncbi:hypothetical protein JJV70_20375 [Streptomyces sp. JJ66]|uniref:hypothetical protein n=1 Tax=Streptomyces sp. JJ66 TaxID=2803843 RepID=UPI001C5A1AC1|nr:hypothetical protein [Streptomyces sp. JJ66]MBW1604415.1 hypothetical protein [Streptomyces sp. JJ66]